jgi:hypothetical protein
VRKETRPTLFERSEFVGRPKRGLAALEMGCRDFKARAPVNGVFHPELPAGRSYALERVKQIVHGLQVRFGPNGCHAIQ